MVSFTHSAECGAWLTPPISTSDAPAGGCWDPDLCSPPPGPPARPSAAALSSRHGRCSLLCSPAHRAPSPVCLCVAGLCVLTPAEKATWTGGFHQHQHEKPPLQTLPPSEGRLHSQTPRRVPSKFRSQ